MTKLRIASATLAMALVSACGVPQAAAPSRPATAAPPPPQRPAAPSTGFIAPQVMDLPGLDGVIGADANSLLRQFGTPRLDVWEGDARKLQFAGTACTLDIFLYPRAPGAGETATWVEARRTDGRDVDRAACVKALRR